MSNATFRHRPGGSSRQRLVGIVLLAFTALLTIALLFKTIPAFDPKVDQERALVQAEISIVVVLAQIVQTQLQLATLGEIIGGAQNREVLTNTEALVMEPMPDDGSDVLDKLKRWSSEHDICQPASLPESSVGYAMSLTNCIVTGDSTATFIDVALIKPDLIKSREWALFKEVTRKAK